MFEYQYGYQCDYIHDHIGPGGVCPSCGGVADRVTAGVVHRWSTALVMVGPSAPRYNPTGLMGYPLVDGQREQCVSPNHPDWWRCDACGHAVAFRREGELQLACPHCGAQMPKRYDP